MSDRFIRVATVEDIPALLVLVEKFANEATLGMQFDEAQSREYLQAILTDPDISLFIADDVSAVIMATVVRDFFVKPSCYVDYMYVASDKRGIGLSRALVQTVVTYAKMRNCSHVLSGTHASINDRISQMFINLFRKSGFITCGHNLLKAI